MKKLHWVLAGITALLAALGVLCLILSPKGSVTRITVPVQDAPTTPPQFVLPDMQKFQMPEGPNLAEKCKVTVSGYADVYMGAKATDGRDMTYWEGNAFPSVITVDLGENKKFSRIVLKLPPLRIWGARTQVLSVSVGADGENYSVVVPQGGVDFDPQTGNAALLEFSAVEARYVRVEFASNTGASGGQLSELCVFE